MSSNITTGAVPTEAARPTRDFINLGPSHSKSFQVIRREFTNREGKALRSLKTIGFRKLKLKKVLIIVIVWVYYYEDYYLTTKKSHKCGSKSNKKDLLMRRIDEKSIGFFEIPYELRTKSF